MNKVTLTLSVPTKLKNELKQFREVNWSEETRRFLEERVKRLRVLKKFDELTKNSELTEEDAIELGRRINKEIAKKHGLNV